MPTISIFFGIVIHWRDHAPPHRHAFYQGFDALVEIETGAILRGHLPLAAAAPVRAWVQVAA